MAANLKGKADTLSIFHFNKLLGIHVYPINKFIFSKPQEDNTANEPNTKSAAYFVEKNLHHCKYRVIRDTHTEFRGSFWYECWYWNLWFYFLILWCWQYAIWMSSLYELS